MTLQASGQISLADIAAEFGGPTPRSLQNYYRGGAYVPNVTQNNGIPTSGAIGLQDFYGASAVQPLLATLGCDTTPYGSGTVDPPSKIIDTVTTSYVCCTASGGVGPYTVSIEKLSGDTNWSTNVVSSSNGYLAISFTLTSSTGTHLAYYRFKVEDSNSGQTYTATVTVTVDIVDVG